MKIVLQVILLCLCASQIFIKVNGESRSYFSSPGRSDTAIYPYPQILAEFPGGQGSMNRFIYSNMKYPDSAKQAEIEGKVILQFKVDTLGVITDVKVIKGIGLGCDAEAARIVGMMPRWKPAKNNGQHVTSLYHLPIIFLMNN